MPTAISHLRTLTTYGLNGANQPIREPFLLYFPIRACHSMGREEESSTTFWSQLLPGVSYWEDEFGEPAGRLEADCKPGGQAAAGPRAVFSLVPLLMLWQLIWKHRLDFMHDFKRWKTDIQTEVPLKRRRRQQLTSTEQSQTQHIHSCSPPSCSLPLQAECYSISMLKCTTKSLFPTVWVWVPEAPNEHCCIFDDSWIHLHAKVIRILI